jgi:HEAT repeat protein
VGKRKPLKVFSAAVVVLLIGFFCLTLASRPPLYEGQTLKEWVDECTIIRLTNDSTRPLIWGPRIRSFGPSAVPELVNMMEDRHPLKERFYNLIFRRRITNQWMNDLRFKAKLDEERPANAAYFLSLMGSAAEPAVPALLRTLAGTNLMLRASAIGAMGGIHQRPEIVVPVLANLLSNKNDWIFAVKALRKFGPNAVPAIPALRDVATNAGTFQKLAAMQALAQLAPETSSDIIVPFCINIIETDRTLRSSCITLLWCIGPDASNAVPALTKIAERENSDQLVAAYTLKRIDPEGAVRLWPNLPRASRLNGVFPPPHHLARQEFLKRVKDMGPQGFTYLTNLVMNRPPSGSSTSEASYAAYALGEMGQGAVSAVPILEAVATDSKSYLWPAATAALMKIRGESPAPLYEAAGDPDEITTWGLLLKVIAQFDTQAEPAIPNILTAMNRTRADNATQALGAIALGRIRRRPDLCVPVLASILDYPSQSARSSAMDALLAFGPDARPALPEVIEALDDLDPYVRDSATNLVKILEPAALTNSVVK